MYELELEYGHRANRQIEHRNKVCIAQSTLLKLKYTACMWDNS